MGLGQGLLAAQNDSLKRKDFEDYTLMFPRAFEPYKAKAAFAVLFTRLPMDWVETSLDIPIFQFELKYGLPYGFSLKSTFQSIVVSNQIRLGPRWNTSLGKFAMGAGLDMSFLYGRMNIDGFNNEAIGWAYYPNVSIGLHFKKIAFTCSGELNNIFSMRIKAGEAEITSTKNFKSGFSFSFFMEQYLWKNHILITGIINNFQKFFYPAWPAFSAFNRQYYIPQIYIGLVL
jgi:hypothetical protein